MNRGRTFFYFAFLPQAIWVATIMTLTFAGVFQLWPKDYNNKLLFPSILVTAIVAIILAIYFEVASSAGTRPKGTRPLFIAGFLQIVALFWAVMHTGDLDGSPFSFYYLYIPSVVGVTFFAPSADSSEGLIKQIISSPGTKAAGFTAIVCGLCVFLHIFAWPSPWTPFSTIRPDDLDTVSSLCATSSNMDSKNVKIIADICAQAQPLKDGNAKWYRIIRLATFLFPLIMGLWTQFDMERRSGTNTPQAQSKPGG